MDQLLTPDICVVGAGTAGLTVAAAAAAMGVPVVLVEKARMGGAHLASADVPTKALIAVARRMHDVRNASTLGVTADDPRVNFPAVMAHVRAVVAAAEPNSSAERLAGLGVLVLRGEARFLDRRTVAVGNARIRARRFVIATGSRPAVPPIPGLSTVPYLTSETVFDLKRLPARLAIIGGGRSGLEFAQAFRRLGSEVVVLESGSVLAGDDPELVALLAETLRAEGVDIREGARIARVARRGRTAVRLNLEGTEDAILDATHLLVATGRLADTEQLGLKQAGIAFDERGVKASRRLRTTNRRVYAIGDVVAGGPRFTHWAGYQARLVVRSILFRFGGKARPDLLAWVTFTDPELAHAGIGEAEALRRYRRISILRWPFAENERARAEGGTRGLVKIIATRGGRIVGAEVLGRDAGELIAPIAVAVAEGANVKTFAASILPGPTRAEAILHAARSLSVRQRDSSWLRRAIGFVRKLG